MRCMMPVLVALLLAGCADMNNPSERQGSWRPTGVNDQNLRAMVAEPAHLQRGVGAPGTVGPAATQPVDRLYRDQVRALPETRIAPVGAATGGAGAGR
jgi:hypothetical protein